MCVIITLFKGLFPCNPKGMLLIGGGVGRMFNHRYSINTDYCSFNLFCSFFWRSAAVSVCWEAREACEVPGGVWGGSWVPTLSYCVCLDGLSGMLQSVQTYWEAQGLQAIISAYRLCSEILGRIVVETRHVLCSAAARNLAMPAVDKWRPSRQSFREAAVQVSRWRFCSPHSWVEEYGVLHLCKMWSSGVM